MSSIDVCSVATMNRFPAAAGFAIAARCASATSRTSTMAHPTFGQPGSARARSLRITSPDVLAALRRVGPSVVARQIRRGELEAIERGAMRAKDLFHFLATRERAHPPTDAVARRKKPQDDVLRDDPGCTRDENRFHAFLG